MDESAFREFYERTNRSLWLYIAGMVRDDALTDDLFQESYIRFLQSNVEFGNDATRKSYLYRIATNCARDHWRRMKREREWSESEGAKATHTGDPVEIRHDLQEAFARLSPQQRSLLWLAYAEEYRHKEIAEILELKEKSVKVLLYRAKQKMISLSARLDMTGRITP